MISIAQWGLLLLLSLFLLLHLLILIKIIPYHLVWDGRLKTDRDMYRFEVFSLLINTLFIVVVLVQANLLAINIPSGIITAALWLMTGLFLLNTCGNAVSKNKLEQRLFTPLTLLLAICCACLAWAN